MKNMNLYVISQDVNNSYDSFDSAVVAAPDESTARTLHPRELWNDNTKKIDEDDWTSDWAEQTHVDVRLIGIADPSIVKAKVILASFNAG